jgi:hypothetical protein
MKHRNKQKGNIALTTVLFTSTILVLGGLALVIVSIDFTLSTKAYYHRSLAKIRTRSCVQEGLYRIKQEPVYTGTSSLTFTDGSCSVTVVDTAVANTKSLSIISTVNGYSMTSTKKADISTSPFTVTN